MERRPPSFTLADTLFPSTTLFRSVRGTFGGMDAADEPTGTYLRRVPRTAGHLLPYLRYPLPAIAVADGIAPLASECAPRDLRARRRLVALPFARSEEHTSELQSLMRISYAVLCLKKKNTQPH